MTGKPDGHRDFNFLVDLGGGPAAGGEAGFEACTIGGVDVSADDLPSGEATTITLRRGVVDSDQLAGWLGGDRDHVRTVRVALQSDDRRTTVAAWTLANARINRLAGGGLTDQDSTDLAVDELTLGGEAVVPDATG
jgi:hypothetical protein